MSAFTDDLAKVMQDKLRKHFDRMPGETPISIPVRMLADAVEEVLADGRQVPQVPRYDAELAEKQRWSGLTADLGSYVPPSIAADVDGPGVVLTIQQPVEYAADAPEGQAPPIKLEALSTDMRAFALHLLAVCEQAEKNATTPDLYGPAADAELEQREIRVLGG